MEYLQRARLVNRGYLILCTPHTSESVYGKPVFKFLRTYTVVSDHMAKVKVDNIQINEHCNLNLMGI